MALYNGTREMPSLDQEWSDYRVHLNADCDIDIPQVSRAGVFFRRLMSVALHQPLFLHLVTSFCFYTSFCFSMIASWFIVTKE